MKHKLFILISFILFSSVVLNAQKAPITVEQIKQESYKIKNDSTLKSHIVSDSIKAKYGFTEKNLTITVFKKNGKTVLINYCNDCDFVFDKKKNELSTYGNLEGHESISVYLKNNTPVLVEQIIAIRFKAERDDAPIDHTEFTYNNIYFPDWIKNTYEWQSRNNETLEYEKIENFNTEHYIKEITKTVNQLLQLK